MIFPSSDGQYVGLFGVAKSQLYAFIALISSRPFGVIRCEPHAVSFALKSPARMNCFPILSKTSTNISLEILCLGGQYTAPILVSLLLYEVWLLNNETARLEGVLEGWGEKRKMHSIA